MEGWHGGGGGGCGSGRNVSTSRATILMAQEMAAVRVIADTFW